MRLLFLLCFLVLRLHANLFHVSVDGSVNGDGQIASPWDLQTALNHPTSISPGDTIYIHEGIYSGNFISFLEGIENKFIYLMQAPNERATIQDSRQYASGATMQINGSWTIYKDFEVCNSNPNRNSSASHDFRPMGFQVNAPNTKFINLIVHDVGHGFGFWKEAVNSEIYGCLIYNCGTYNSPGNYSTHGHGIYSQNDSGLKKIRNNFIFNQFGFGIHIYPNPGNINGYLIEGNTLFHNGILTNDSVRYNNIIVNTYSPYECKNIDVIGNYTYDAKVKFVYKNLIDADIYLGTSSKNSSNLLVKDNYFAGQGRPGMAILNWDAVTFSNNNLFYDLNGSIGLVIPTNISTSAYIWNKNQYYSINNNKQFSFQYGASNDFDSWKLTTHFDATSNFTINTFPTNKIIILKNEYEKGRANIIIYNWTKLENVDLNLSDAGLVEGQSYKIVDASNYFGSSVYSGVYNEGNSTIPINFKDLTQSSKPVGLNYLTNTAPEFAAFVLLPGEISTTTKSLNCIKFEVYPNPSSEIININWDQSAQYPISIKLVDAQGKIIEDQTFNTLNSCNNTLKINCSNLSEGLYFIKFMNKDQHIIKKLIIKK